MDRPRGSIAESLRPSRIHRFFTIVILWKSYIWTLNRVKTLNIEKKPLWKPWTAKKTLKKPWTLLGHWSRRINHQIKTARDLLGQASVNDSRGHGCGISDDLMMGQAVRHVRRCGNEVESGCGMRGNHGRLLHGVDLSGRHGGQLLGQHKLFHVDQFRDFNMKPVCWIIIIIKKGKMARFSYHQRAQSQIEIWI